MSTLLDINAITCRYGEKEIFRDLSFGVAKGSIACLLGPSGCGKTTALRAIAGFEPIYSGSILLDNRRLSAPGITLPPEQREVGMVFQDYALFPHMTVAANIAFGLQQRSKPERERVTRELLELIRLQDSAKAYPHQLSGGQQQRVALARALAPKPKLLLLDEPFSNLDVDLRERLAIEVRDILKAEGTTAILVTHDQHEAFALADQIGVMHEGRIQQWDAPYELYHRPVNRFVADFVGQGVFLPGTVIEPGRIQVELGVLPSDTGSAEPGAMVKVLLRPDDVIHDDASGQQAEVVAKAFRGAEFMYTLRLASGELLLSLVPSHHNHAIGEHIGIRLAIDHVVAFPSPPLD